MSFQLPGYEDLQLSTQVIIRAAQSRGIEVDVLNRATNFIRLRKGDLVEYVSQGTETSKDSIITYKMMENKDVAKQVLDEHGVRVPQGEQYAEIETARQGYPQFAGRDVVVKPNATNYGVGITFVRANHSENDYQRALEIAFSHDSTVLVEEFIAGDEYRCLVIDDEVRAICQRIPANVVGDGKQTIAELVVKKNQDPKRGIESVWPLATIKLGEAELFELKKQTLSPESVVEAGVQVFLRRNSNISTGGDSVDRTDFLHPGYSDVAVKAAKAVRARITGVDLMTSEPTEAPTNNNHAIIEVNFNPVLYIHAYPFEGEARNVGEYLLDVLGFSAD